MKPPPDPKSPRSKRARSAAGRRPSPRTGRSIRLRTANTFDLIRLIAHSQNDPRKAIAELVQNSLDAGAGNVTISRARRAGRLGFSILDDGSGVFPALGREEALERIATNIGRSFKKNLSPEERQEQMQLGQYGIGILGFWAVGQTFEMCTRVDGSETWALRLVRDEPVGEVFRVRERKIAFAGETWTEVLVNDVHDSAGRQLSARRLGDYLGSELRGQLLERGVKLRIVDRTARGRALKDFLVTPKRYRGRRLLDIADLAVPGFSRARLEIYHAGQEATEAAGPRPAIALTCGGVVVCDDLAAIEGREFDRAPWNLGVYEGVVEFPDLEVSPATRRGFSPGPAADALFEALRTVEPELLRVAEIERERRRVEEDESLARDLKRVFRPLVRNLPQYEFFDVRTQGSAGVTRSSPEVGEAMGSSSSDDSAPGDPTDPRSGVEAEDDASEADAEADADDDTKDTDTPDETAGEAPPPPPESEIIESGDMPEPPAEVLPPGPLAELRISPRRSRLLRGARRELSARPVDATGRTIERTVDIEWTLAEGPGLLAAEGCRATFVAPDELGLARILARAVEGDRSAEAEATVVIVETLMGGQRDAGIPSPRRAFDPSGDWRSRMRGRRWEYNAAHPDYRAVVDDPRRRFRYLVHLLAKEIVLRNYGEPKDERILERVVEVLTHIHPRG